MQEQTWAIIGCAIGLAALMISILIQNYNLRRNIVADIEKTTDLKFDKFEAKIQAQFSLVDSKFESMLFLIKSESEKNRQAFSRIDEAFARIEKKLDQIDAQSSRIDTQIHELQTKTCVLAARFDDLRKVG